MSFASNYVALKAASAQKKQAPSVTTTSNGGSTSSSSRYGETFLASIGTDVVPVPIQRIASINDAAYLKNASFHSISQAAYGLLDTYSVNNVMMFVGQHLPINHSMALTEAANVRSTIRSRMLLTQNIVATAFVNKNWKKVQTKHSDKLSDRTEGIFGVKFSCELSGPDIDSRILPERSLCTEFVLKLPQHLYDKSSQTVAEVSSPVKKKAGLFNTPTSKPSSHVVNLFQSADDDDDEKKEEAKVESGDEDDDDEESVAAKMEELGKKLSTGEISYEKFRKLSAKVFENETARKESALLAQSSPTTVPISPGLDAGMFLSGTTKVEGYYGKFNFLESQDLFNSCFGSRPKPYHWSEREMLWPEKEEIGNFADLCQFDVFMNLCQSYYVGDSNVSKESFVREVCANITKLRQQWQDGTTLVVLTPEELFQQFLRESTNLPDDTSTWTIQLPSQFLVALNDDITAEITQSTTFSIPSQAGLVTKMDHITGMRLIKNEASKIFTSQLRAKERMRLELSKLTNKKFPALYSSTPSQAEQTITKYKGSEHPDIEIRLCQGVKHPFHIPTNTLSRYPCGFRGCYNCGSKDHYNTKDCTKKFDRNVFFPELWCHRPHQYTHKKKDDKKHAEHGTNEKALAAYGPSDRDVDNTPAWLKRQRNQQQQQELQQPKQQQQQPTDEETTEVVGSWMGHIFEEDSPSKRHKLWVCKLARVLTTQLSLREMPLKTDSNLPAMSMRLGVTDENEVSVRFNLDTCAGMTTGNKKLHQYIITNFPEIVHSYEEYNGSNPFSPIILEGVTSTGDNSDFETGKLTAIVTYYTRYTVNGEALTISFGLGDSIAVNGIIGLPTLREWKMVLDIDEGIAYSKLLNLRWNMEFIDASQGLPQGVSFTEKDFVPPNRSLATMFKQDDSSPQLDSTDSTPTTEADAPPEKTVTFSDSL